MEKHNSICYNPDCKVLSDHGRRLGPLSFRRDVDYSFSLLERRDANDYIHRAVSVLRFDRRHYYAGCPDNKKEIAAQLSQKRRLFLTQ